MRNLTDREWEAHVWLSRMWGAEGELESYKAGMERVISQLSGIGKYDAEFVPAQTGENSVETKYLNYSQFREKHEKLMWEIMAANNHTAEIIAKVGDRKMRGMLFDRYIERLSWAKIGEKYHYAQRQPYYYMHKCLAEVRRFIPDEEILEVIND